MQAIKLSPCDDMAQRSTQQKNGFKTIDSLRQKAKGENIIQE